MSRNIKEERVDMALEEMAEVKRVEQETRQVFKDASDTLRKELKSYDARQENHIEGLLEEYVKRQMQSCSILLSILDRT